MAASTPRLGRGVILLPYPDLEALRLGIEPLHTRMERLSVGEQGVANEDADWLTPLTGCTTCLMGGRRFGWPTKYLSYPDRKYDVAW